MQDVKQEVIDYSHILIVEK